MSIYGTWLHLSADEHENGCDIYVEDPAGSHILMFSGKPCSCGTPRAPLVYQGSHILPRSTDPRGGLVSVAAIPDFITRDGRDDAQGTGLKDWLRLSLAAGDDYATVVLDRPLVEELRDTLTNWLEREETE